MPDTAMTAEPTDTATAAPALRVLCVDDHPDTADSLAALLGLSGFEVTAAHDAEEALAALAAGFRPDAAVLDISMPRIDGCELARRLRSGAGGDALLLVALTALGDYASLSRMADAGFDLHFEKPVEAGQLFDALTSFARNGRP